MAPKLWNEIGGEMQRREKTKPRIRCEVLSFSPSFLRRYFGMQSSQAANWWCTSYEALSQTCCNVFLLGGVDGISGISRLSLGHDAEDRISVVVYMKKKTRKRGASNSVRGCCGGSPLTEATSVAVRTQGGHYAEPQIAVVIFPDCPALDANVLYLTPALTCCQTLHHWLMDSLVLLSPSLLGPGSAVTVLSLNRTDTAHWYLSLCSHFQHQNKCAVVLVEMFCWWTTAK